MLLTEGVWQMADGRMSEWQRNILSQERLSKKEKKKRANGAKVQLYFCFSSSFLFFSLPNLSSMFFCISQKKILYEKKWEKKERKQFLYQSYLKKKERKKRSPVYKKLKRNTHTTWNIQIWAFSISAIMPSLPSLPHSKIKSQTWSRVSKKNSQKIKFGFWPQAKQNNFGTKEIMVDSKMRVEKNWWSKGTTTFVFLFSSSSLHPKGLFFSAIFCHFLPFCYLPYLVCVLKLLLFWKPESSVSNKKLLWFFFALSL